MILTTSENLQGRFGRIWGELGWGGKTHFYLFIFTYLFTFSIKQSGLFQTENVHSK